MEAKLWVVALVAFCGFLGGVAQILLKIGADSVTFAPLELVQNPYLVVGASFYGVSLLLYLFALQYGNVSLLYPVIATSYVWVALLAKPVLGEAFPLHNWAGIALIIGGITVLHL